MRFKWMVALAMLFFIIASARASGVLAAPMTTITVNTTADEVNNDGDCSLREAVKAANTNAAVDACAAGSVSDIIQLPSGIATSIVYTLSLTGAGDNSGDLDLKTNITVVGTQKSRAIIEGGSGWADRVIEIAANANATLDHVVIRKGNFAQAGDGAGIRINSGATVTIDDSVITLNTNKALGAGIFNQGTLTMLDSTISENTADSGSASAAHGGGLYNEGTVTLTNVKVQDNTTQASGAFAEGGNLWNSGTLTLDRVTVSGGAAFSGGGSYNNETLNVLNSTLNGNEAQNGGGIYSTGGTLKITNSTLSSNAGGAGSGLYFAGGGISTLSNVTLTLNQASVRGAIFKGNGTLRVKNSILAGNSAPDNPDCFGGVSSDGNNLLGVHDNSCNAFVNGVNGDLVGMVNAPLDPKLNALANNGGKTQTHALQSSSPAIDAGNAAGCTDGDGNALTTDQRGTGFARTLDGFGSGTPRCDMGAYEASANSGQTPTHTPTRTPTNTRTPTSIATPILITATGVVWNDLNFDGIRDAGEPFVQGITVEMRSGDKAIVHETAVTDVNGNYTVHGPPGNLLVRVLLPNGSTFSPQNEGNDNLVDSDVAASGEHLGYSNPILQSVGGIRIDAGMYSGATPTPTWTFTPSATNTRTLTPTRTNTIPPNSTSTPSATNTRTPTPTRTNTIPPNSTSTFTPTRTLTPTATGTITNSCTAKPAKPTLKKPKNNSIVSSTRPKLTWNAATCATTYNVTIKDVATNKKADGKKNLTELQFKTKTLAAKKTFKWFVHACNAHGCTKSKTRTLTLE